MAKYLLIESRDPFENRSSEHFLELAQRMAVQGDQIVLYLIQNGVLSARKMNQYCERVKDLISRKIPVLADALSLQERGIQEHERLNGLVISNMDQLLEYLLEPGLKTIWH